MKINTAIFDMDGLLIDSEPLWEEAGAELLREFNIDLTPEQYHSSTGLRTKEWVTHWFNYFNVDGKHTDAAVENIIKKSIEKIDALGIAMPGVPDIFLLLQDAGIKMGLATSSPLSLVDIVVDKLGIRKYLQTLVSAESLPYGKPHPDVYINCAGEIGVAPTSCFCFEDSFNGMIAVKAARMKCVVVPAPNLYDLEKWGAADMKLHSLLDFNAGALNRIIQ
jgi:mannitol-1-/sugar-/sorbitol-6-/2-deoxyglucose-6-phosphatase